MRFRFGTGLGMHSRNAMWCGADHDLHRRPGEGDAERCNEDMSARWSTASAASVLSVPLAWNGWFGSSPARLLSRMAARWTFTQSQR